MVASVPAPNADATGPAAANCSVPGHDSTMVPEHVPSSFERFKLRLKKFLKRCPLMMMTALACSSLSGLGLCGSGMDHLAGAMTLLPIQKLSIVGLYFSTCW